MEEHCSGWAYFLQTYLAAAVVVVAAAAAVVVV